MYGVPWHICPESCARPLEVAAGVFLNAFAAKRLAACGTELVVHLDDFVHGNDYVGDQHAQREEANRLAVDVRPQGARVWRPVHVGAS